MKFDRPVGSDADLTDEERVAYRAWVKEKEEKEENYTITPQNVDDLAARLTYLVNCQGWSGHEPIQFIPSADVCAVKMRIFAGLSIFDIVLTDDQVGEFLQQGLKAADSWAQILRTDIVKMAPADGTDPRVHKPEEL